jgi:hypothetical protein
VDIDRFSLAKRFVHAWRGWDEDTSEPFQSTVAS